MKVHFKDIRTRSERVVFRICVRSEPTDKGIPVRALDSLQKNRKHVLIRRLPGLKNGCSANNSARDWLCIVMDNTEFKEDFNGFISAIKNKTHAEVSSASIRKLKQLLGIDISEENAKEIADGIEDKETEKTEDVQGESKRVTEPIRESIKESADKLAKVAIKVSVIALLINFLVFMFGTNVYNSIKTFFSTLPSWL